MRFGYLEASAAAERTATRYIMLIGGMVLLQAMVWISMSSSRSAGVSAYGGAISSLSTLGILLLNLGPQIDHWRVAAREREAEAPTPRMMICCLSGFLLLWSGLSAVIIIAPTLVVLFRLSQVKEDGFGYLMQGMTIFSIVMWIAIPAIFLWRSTRRLILAAEGLLLPGSERQISWRDVTQYELRPMGTNLTLLLTLSDAANQQFSPGFRRWFNPVFSLASNQITLNLSGYDKSQKAIYDYFKDNWWAARETD